MGMSNLLKDDLKNGLSEPFCNDYSVVSFIKDTNFFLIPTYAHCCPLHCLIKDILYVQAQRGRALAQKEGEHTVQLRKP